MWLRLSWWLACASMWTAAPAGAQDALPELVPGQPGSHEVFDKHLSAAGTLAVAGLLAIYQEHIDAYPGDVIGRIERCMFIDGLSALEELVVEDLPDPDECAAQARRSFPTDTRVALFALERQWGEDAIAFGEELADDPQLSWSATERGRYYAQMAQLHAGIDDTRNAGKYAVRAQQSDDTLDLSSLIASDLQQRGKVVEAVRALTSRLERDKQPYSLISKARQLIEMEAFRPALRAVELAEAAGLDDPDPVLYGRALEGVGQTRRAREKYLQGTKDWNRKVVLERLFYVDLRSGDQKRAVESYRALRDQGSDADFYMRHRLALLWHHPLAPWQWRELAGVLGLLYLLAFVGALTATVVLPIHYVGMLRRERGAEFGPPPSGWTLRTAAWICFATAACDIVVLYLFVPSEIDVFFDDGAVAPTHSAREIAHAGIASTLGLLLAGVATVRRHDLVRLAHNEWHALKTVGAVVLSLFVLLFVAGLNRKVIVALGWELPWQFDAPGAMPFDTMHMIRAVHDEYGPGALIFVLAALVPLSEELAFRGVLFDAFRRHLPTRWANATQALVFGLAHEYYGLLPYYMVVGLLCGRMRLRSGGLVPSVLLHMALNFTVCLSFIVLARLGIQLGASAR